MRLLVVVVDHQHKAAVHRALAEKEFGATVLESSGGFLGRGSATILMVVDDERVDEAIQVIRSLVRPVEREGVEGRRATVGTNVFVVPVEAFQKS